MSAYTSMIKVDEAEFRGDAQVLSVFFKYHSGKSSRPEVFNSDENHQYRSTKKVDTASAKV